MSGAAVRDHHVWDVASKSERRAELAAAGGKMMAPDLVDPNTDVAMDVPGSWYTQLGRG